QHLANLLDLTLVCRQSFRKVGWLLLRATKPTATSAGYGRVVDHEGELRHDRHLFRRRAEQIDQCSLARDQTTGGSGEGVRDAFNTSDGDVSAVRINRHDRFRVWVQLTDLGCVNGAVRTLRNLDESHACARVDHAGINRQSAAVDRLRARWYGNICADSFDLSIANHDRSVFDVCSTHGHNSRVANRERSTRRHHSLLRGWITNLLGP